MSMLEMVLNEITDWMVTEGTSNTEFGNWIFYKDELQDKWPKINFDNRNLIDCIITALYSHEQVAHVEVEWMNSDLTCIDVDFNTGYCPNCEDFNDHLMFPKSVWNEIRQAHTSDDNVNHPSHYTQGGIECIEAIRASMSPEAFQGYCKGNVMKYIWRSAMKNGLEDLKKAQVYLGWMIESVEKNDGKTD